MRRAHRLYLIALWFELVASRHERAEARLRARAARRDTKARHFEDLADRYDDLSREARR